MSTNVDKQELMEWLEKLDDPNILKNIQILKKQSEQSALKWNDLPEEVKEGISQGRRDIKAGRFISNDEFWEKYDHRL